MLEAVRELVMVTPVALDDALEDGGLHGVDALEKGESLSALSALERCLYGSGRAD